MKRFSVISPTDIIETLNCESLIGNRSKPLDHSLLQLTTECSLAVREKLCGNTLGSKEVNRSRVIRRVNKKYMSNELADRMLPTLLEEIRDLTNEQDELNSCYQKLTSFILEEAEAAKVTRNNIRPNTKMKEYWDNSLSKCWKNMKECERLFHQEHNPHHKNEKHHHFKMAQRRFDKLLKHKKRNYNKGRTLKINECLTKDPQAFWKYIKKMGPNKPNEIPMEVKIDGKITNNINLELKKWKDDFHNLYKFSDSPNFDESFKAKKISETITCGVVIQDVNFLNSKITKDEVDKVIATSKMNKAVGLDGIPNELLKHEPVVKLLHSIFNVCLELNRIPDPWRKAIIHPIPKTKEIQLDPMKYRGLALQSCIFKLYCGILNNRLVKHLEENKLICDKQNGFRRNRSCLHHIFALSTIVNKGITSRKTGIFSAFMDFKKAFDYVDRELLTYKLKTLGVEGKLLKSLQAIHTDTVSTVRLNGLFTEEFLSTKGVLQGNTISLTLFSIFINDLLDELQKSGLGISINGKDDIISVLTYADDIVLLSPTEEGLQGLLDIVGTWCSRWRVSVNTSKMKCIHFRRSGCPLTSHTFSLLDNLETVNSYCYLGLELDEHMNFKPGTETIRMAASRALGCAISKSKDNFDLSHSVFSKIFEACVVPILDYASGVWSRGNQFKKLNDIQYRACRFFMGVPKLCPLLAIMAEMGWIPGTVRRDLETLRLYNQLVQMDTDRLTRKVFEMDLESNGLWSENVKSILNSLGKSELLTSRSIVNINDAKSKLMEMYESVWLEEINSKPKLRTYKLIKRNIEPEQYLTADLPKWKRSLVAHLLLYWENKAYMY